MGLLSGLVAEFTPRLNTTDESVPEKYVTVGKITGHFGVKGWIKIKSYTRPIEQIFDYPEWYLTEAGSARSRSNWMVDARLGPLRLQSWQARDKNLIACFCGVECRNDAEDYVGKVIEIPEQALPELDRGEFYWSQLIGLQVFNTEGVHLGQVDHLVETGANDVLVVTDRNKTDDVVERLVPWIEQVVVCVQLAKGKMVVDWDAEF